DSRPLKKDQKKLEISNGLTACVIFAVGSLVTRELFSSVWPETLIAFVAQVAAFSIFYEVYSYFVHRLLHGRLSVKMHGVHHGSVRVTPWSAYSVHPVEAVFIGLSAPLYMALFPWSLG